MINLTSVRGELRRILSLALPIIGGNMAMMGIGVTDTIMVGWHSVEGLAALVLATTLFSNVMFFGIGFATALVPLVASAHATHDPRQVRQTTRMALWISCLFALLAMPIFFNAETIFLILGQDSEISALAQSYLYIAGPSLIVVLWATVIRSYLSALELVTVATLIMAGIAICNIGTNYVLIFGHFGFPEMGVRGAALSSLILNTLQAVVISIYAIRKLPEHELFVRFWRANWDALRRVFKMGVPIGLSILSEVGFFSASTFMMGWLGVVALAAHGIALQIASVTFMAHLGVSQAATIRVGNAYGRGAFDDLRDRAVSAVGLSILWSSFTITLFLIFGTELVAAFLAQEEPARDAIIVYGVMLLSIAALFQLVDGLQVAAIGLLRGVQDTAIPMVITVISYWGVGFSSAYTLAFVFDLGGAGLWFGLVIGLSAAAIALAVRFIYLFRAKAQALAVG